MAKRTAAVVARAVRTVSPELAALGDRELLKRFADDGDQAAFAAVVTRHTAMVLGVCKRVLHSPADAEDATQAVFLVLAKKAKGTRWQASAANWLYTTARKVAHNARLSAERRNKRERSAAMPEATNPADTMSGRELIAALDDELDKLTTRYREPLVLCYLEGLTRDEAAARLNLAVPALNKQLERGRKKLADALAARGCALGVLLLAAASTSSAGASPPQLHESILAAAGGTPSESVAALAQGVAMNGLLTRTRLVVMAVVGISVLGFGTAALYAQAQPPQADKTQKAKPDTNTDAKPGEEKSRTISGTVVGPDNKPMAGASITTMKPGQLDKPATVELGKTDADGKFTVTLDPVPNGRPDYRQLVATKSGYGSDWTKVGSLNEASVTLKLVPDDVPVKGRVTDLEGKPVAKATVHITSLASGDLTKVWGDWARAPYQALQRVEKELWRAQTAGLPESVATDADGKFEISGVGRGRFLGLKIEANGIETAACRVVTDPAFDPKKVDQPSHATMPGGAYQPGPDLYGPTFIHSGKPSQPITGTVTDAHTGKPMAGVQVNANVSGPHWWENHTTARTDADGKFKINGVGKADKVALFVFPGEGSPYLAYNTTVGGKPGLTEITADLKVVRGVKVNGKIVEKGTGKPIFNAAVRYEPLADNKLYADRGFDGRTNAGMAYTTDKDGKFTLTVLPGAAILTAQGETRGRNRGTDFTQVRVAKADLPRADLSHLENLGEAFSAADGHIITLFSYSGYAIIEPKPTDETVDVTIEFDRGMSVTGKVVDADGKPATDVTAYKMTACYDYPQKLKDGTFTAIALEADHPRTVLFVDQAKKQAAFAELKGDEKSLTVKLQAFGTLTGRLVDADGKPIAGASIMVQVKQNMKHMAFQTAVREHPATTDKDGKFALDLPAGPAEYVLAFSQKNKYLNTGYSRDVKGHTLKPGETTTADDAKVKAE